MECRVSANEQATRALFLHVPTREFNSLAKDRPLAVRLPQSEVM